MQGRATQLNVQPDASMRHRHHCSSAGWGPAPVLTGSWRLQRRQLCHLQPRRQRPGRLPRRPTQQAPRTASLPARQPLAPFLGPPSSPWLSWSWHEPPPPPPQTSPVTTPHARGHSFAAKGCTSPGLQCTSERAAQRWSFCQALGRQCTPSLLKQNSERLLHCSERMLQKHALHWTASWGEGLAEWRCWGLEG